MRISEFLAMELALLGGGGARKWWFARTVAVATFIMISGVFLLLLTERLALAYESLVGMWYLISALMISSHFRAKETGMIEVILQRMGGTYLSMSYAVQMAASVVASLIVVALLSPFTLSIEAEPTDILFLLGMCFLGPIIFTTVTMIVIIAFGGRRILDAFSYSIGGLSLVMLVVPFLLLESFTGSSLVLIAGGSIAFMILMMRYFERVDRSKLLEI